MTIELPEHVKRAIYSGPVPTIRDWRNLPVDEMTTGEKVCAFIEEHCIVPEGSLVNQNVKLDIFQVSFVLAVYDNPTDTTLAIFSVARKNAKTALISFLMLAHIVGPVATLNSRISSGAMSRQQAAEVYNYAAKSAQLSPTLRDLVKITPSTKSIHGLPMNTEYRALSADASTNIGGSPAVACIDEIGQVKGPTSDFVDAISTAQAAHDKPLMFYISTQAATDADMFSIAIDDAKLNQPQDVVCHAYTADEDCDVMDKEQWKFANPALGLFRGIKDMNSQAEKANRMPSFENTFRNLLLNQRIASFATFVPPSIWKANNAEPFSFAGLQVFGGLDLSSKTDLTSLVLIAKKGDKVGVKAYFWTPEKGLREREKVDKSPYTLWVKQGLMLTTPSATVDYDFVAANIADITAGLDVAAIAFDRWRIDLFKKSLESVGVTLPLIEYGQGYKDMAPALDELETLLLNKNICHGDNPPLNMCAINAVAVMDPANNRKLEKRKSSGRIDGMQALAMAVGAMIKQEGGKVTEQDVDDFLDSMDFI